MTREGTVGEPTQAPTPPRTPAPEVGAILSTIYGAQRVMDVLRGLPDDPRPTVYLRPERGGLEWTVTLTELPRVLRAEGDR